MSRSQRRAAVLAGVLLAAASPSAAQARAELDRTFSGDGRIKLAAAGDRATSVVETGGRLFLSDDRGEVTAVTSRGRQDTGYARGSLSGRFAALSNTVTLLADPRGADPRGLLVVGQDHLTGVGVARLLGNGRRDPAYRAADERPVFYGAGYVYGAHNALADPRRAGGAYVAAGKNPITPGCAAAAPLDCGVTVQVARLGPAGRPDPSWGEDGVARVPAPFGLTSLALAHGPDDTVTVVGVRFDYGPAAPAPVRVLRLDRDGQVIPAPGGADWRELPPSTGDAVFPDAGRSVWLGHFTGRPGRLTRVLADGTVDPSFTGVRVPGLTQITAVRATADGIVVVGTVRRGTANRPRLVRLTPDGAPDTRFAPGGILEVTFPHVRIDQMLSTVTEDDRGRLVLGGAVGDLFTDIREDYGETTLGMMRVRTRAPVLDVAGSRVSVDGRGVARLRVRCSARAPAGCQGVRVHVRRGGRPVGRADVRLEAGSVRTVRVRVGTRGRSLARRRAAVEVGIVPVTDPARPQETAAVSRQVRLVVRRAPK